MSETIRCNLSQLGQLIEKRVAKLQKRLEGAIEKTVDAGVSVVRAEAPKAFGDLRNSVHAEHGKIPKIVVDAPHAGAVEQGSAPHTPDLERLIAWVKLRGMQGLRNIRSDKHGTTTQTQARSVKQFLANEVQTGPGGKFSPIDAPRKVAEAIAKTIEEEGTKPNWFVRNSLPGIANRLNKNVRKALNKP